MERSLLENFHFESGGVPEDDDDSAVIISSATATRLHIGLGDDLIVSIRSDRGRINTVDLIVRGIFSESSFFGFQTYMNRKTLNQLREAPQDTINEVGVYLEHPFKHENKAVKLLAEELDKVVPFFGVMNSREIYNKEAIFVFLIILVVGVSNTFIMIVWERTREIGTLRAIGLQRPGVVLSFLTEAFFLDLSGVFLGVLFGVLVLEVVRLTVEFPSNMVTTLFLTRGRLSWTMPLWGLLTIAGLVTGSCIFGSLRAALRAGKLRPVQAMNHTKN